MVKLNKDYNKIELINELHKELDEEFEDIRNGKFKLEMYKENGDTFVDVINLNDKTGLFEGHSIEVECHSPTYLISVNG